ncbi:hypothetical protein M514_01836 [Trichuris suis]|uniref:Rho-GAP domain-containing protein n=1 Tax=Trichuris suis TaxID=68888 RepID=A0A085NTB5_9BILA|nr:hypothetical protein M514_01836 [Trichuris suis]
MSSTSEETLLQQSRRGVSGSRSPLKFRVANESRSTSSSQASPLSHNIASSPPPPSTSGTPLSSRFFTIAVIGLSGTEREKGLVGVGKSCLCNRFVRPLEDRYRTDHISTLSQVDFGGPVVNNDHWLYWGERVVLSDSGAEIAFRLVEQTEFVDDESFQPLKGSASQREPYLKRCTAIKLHSPDKLMYICKDQLGVEHDYEQKTLPDGRAVVDGFVCVYDVSEVPSRPSERQNEFIITLLHNVMKVKKPFVLTTTKQDALDGQIVRSLEKLISRREFRSVAPVVETSAHFGVNTELPFLLLANMIDRTHSKPKIVSFVDAARRRREIIDVATVAYLHKLKKTVQHFRWTWGQFCRLLQDDPDFEHFCDMCGRVAAQRLFQQYLIELRSCHMQQRRQLELAKLPDALMKLIPDSSVCCGKSWEDIVNLMQTSPMFREIFYTPQQSSDSGDADSESVGDRLSSDILRTPEAEVCFHKHFAYLEAKCARQRLLSDFSQLLANCSQVTPGKPLSDVRLFLMGKEPFESLAEVDLQAVYDQYQRVLIKRARRNFIELMLERVYIFVCVLQQSQLRRRPDEDSFSNAGSPQLDDYDYQYVHDCLQEDSRYRLMNRLHQWRDNAVRKFFAFLHRPSKNNCPFKPRCIDSLISHRMTAAKSPGTHSSDFVNPYYNIFYPITDNQVRILIVGAEMLVHQICGELEGALDGGIFDYGGTCISVNFRCIPDREFSRFFSYVNEYEANGVIVAYSSRQSFSCGRDFIFHTLMDVDVLTSTGEGPMNGIPTGALRRLPVVMLYACDVAHINDVPYLQQQGCNFADALQVRFVGLRQADDFDYLVQQQQQQHGQQGSVMLTAEQVYRTIFSIVHSACIQYPSAGSSNSCNCAQCQSDSNRHQSGSVVSGTVVICLMCGDDFEPDLVLNPLLTRLRTHRLDQCTLVDSVSDQSIADSVTSSLWSLCLNGAGSRSNVVSKNVPVTFNVDVFLPVACNRFSISCSVTSYHCALALTLKEVLFDGYMFIYSPKRRSSLAHLEYAHVDNVAIPNLVNKRFLLSCLSRLLPSTKPMMFVAVGEVVDFFSDQEANGLIMEGSQLADKMNARFVSVSRSTEPSSTIYTSFFEEVWTRKTSAMELCKSTAESDIEKAANTTTTTGHESLVQESPNAKESEYMTLSSFWSGAFQSTDAAVVNGQQADHASVPTSHLFAKRFSESVQQETTKSPRKSTTPLPLGDLQESVLFRQFKQVSSTSAQENLLPPNGTGVPIVSPRRRLEISTTDQGRSNFTGSTFQVAPNRVSSPDRQSSSSRLSEAASAPLATPECVEIPADSLVARNIQFDTSLRSVETSPLDSGRGSSKELEVPAGGTQSQGRRKSLVGPSIAERVRQLTSMLDSSSAADAARSVPGTPTLHGQRERTDRAENVKSPFFFKTFMLPFRSSSEECLTEQTDFIYVKGGKPSELIDAQAPSENATPSNTSASVATPLTSPGLFVRKVASSFRIRKKKATDESKSLPQSPTIEDKVFVLPLNRTPPEEKRLSGDITAANALVSATTMLMSTRLLPSSYVQSRSAKSSVAEKGGKEKRAGKELLAGRKLANQVSDSMLKSSSSKKQVVSSSSLHSKSLASIESSQESSAQDDFVPLFVRKCVEFIEREGEKSSHSRLLARSDVTGMTTEGLYRVPGNQSQVVLIEQKFMEKSDLSLDDLDIPVNAVTTALKNFFASLSEPLVSCALYKPLIEAIVARNVSTTAMDHRNISKCLWPTLVRPEFDSFETMAMMTQTLEDLVLVLLENPSIIEP